jgi:hypothetical protein
MATVRQAITAWVFGGLTFISGGAMAQSVTACAVADAETADRLRLLLANTDSRTPWALGTALSTAKLARAMCSGGKPERGLLLYGRLNEFLDAEMLHIQQAQAPMSAR